MKGLGSSPRLRTTATTSPSISSAVAVIILPSSLMRFALSGIGSDHERLLPEIVDERPTALDIGCDAGDNDEELARLGGIRISEDRRCNVALSVTRMLAREMRRSRRADRAHRKMNCAGHQSQGETVDADVRTPEHDVANGLVDGLALGLMPGAIHLSMST